MVFNLCYHSYNIWFVFCIESALLCNVGDRAHIIEKTKNIHSGDNEESQEFINVDEGTFNLLSRFPLQPLLKFRQWVLGITTIRCSRKSWIAILMRFFLIFKDPLLEFTKIKSWWRKDMWIVEKYKENECCCGSCMWKLI